MAAWLPDAAIVLGLAAIAWLMARDYLLHDLLVWGDHPGQFMRFWYPAAVSLPQFGRVVDWNPLWYGGYPELQFYPPGHALLGLAFSILSLGRLAPERIYNLIPALALVLPIFSVYGFVRIALAPLGRLACRCAGVLAALVGLTFMPMWGGAMAVRIGLMGERLAFGVAPLALLAGWKLVERPTGMRLVVAAALLAALTLLHPFHTPAVVLAVGGYAVARTVALHGGAGAWPPVAAWLLLAAGLVAWWVAPLLAHQTPYAAGLLRTNLSQTLDWFSFGAVFPNLLVASLPALALLAHRDWRVRGTAAAMMLVIASLVLIILFVQLVVIDRLQITRFDPIRLIAEYYLAFILLTGMAAGAVVWLARRTPLLAAGAAILMVFALRPATPTWNDIQGQIRVIDEFTLDDLLRNTAFNGFWEALRDDPHADGRVLFTSYYTQVRWPSGDITPTAIKAMTPFLTGREIMGGTFSHWSPGARLLWVGNPWTQQLPAQVEAEDDQRLFGVPWDQLDDARLVSAARALNITTIVADGDDTNARGRLDRSPSFRRYWDNGHFYLYHRLDAQPAWIEGSHADVRLLERSPRRWVIRVDNATAGATLTARMAIYPLWRADADGRSLTITPNEYGMQEIGLPAGGPYTVTLAYREGLAEWGGLLITLLAIGAAVLLVWKSARRGFPYRT